jgi:UDP-glucuronate decarboxylase
MATLYARFTAIHPYIPLPESYRGNVNRIGAGSCYDEGKRCAETLFFGYRRRHDIKIKVTRIFNSRP